MKSQEFQIVQTLNEIEGGLSFYLITSEFKASFRVNVEGWKTMKKTIDRSSFSIKLLALVKDLNWV